MDEKTRGTWRVVIGSVGGYDLTGACKSWFLGDGLLLDDRFDDYDTARAALEAIYVRWRTDTCTDCVVRAAADEVWLARVPRGGEFVGEVEGDDHLLIRADRTQVQDLWDERERIEAALCCAVVASGGRAAVRAVHHQRGHDPRRC